MDELREGWRALVRSHVRDFERPATDEVWSPELECAPRDRIRALQSEKLVAAYRYLFHCSPFYRRKFEAAGLTVDSVNGIDDLEKIPVTHPEEWIRDQEENPPWGTFSPLRAEDWTTRGWMLFTTSGTKAAFPRVFRHTTFDQEMWTWHGARALYAMGVRPGDIAINCFAYGTSVAFWGLHHALNRMGVPVIPGGGATTDRRALFIDRYRPTVLLCTPSYALVLGREMQAMGLSPADSSIRLLVCAGEPGAGVPATKRRIEALWGASLHDDFGCTEVAMSPLGYTCKVQSSREDGVDVHLMEDQYVVEVLDPATLATAAPGTRGALVVSNLFSEAQPILRYMMGDWISITSDPCACGRTHARAIGGLHGRSDELVKIKGLKFFPSTLEDAVRSLDGVSDEFLLEIVEVDGRDALRVTVEPHDPMSAELIPAFVERCRRRLRALLGIDVAVVYAPHASLPRTLAKAKRLFDRRERRET